MKLLKILLFICIITAVLFAGCSSQEPAPATATPTASLRTVTPVSHAPTTIAATQKTAVATPTPQVMNPDLVPMVNGSWKLIRVNTLTAYSGVSTIYPVSDNITLVFDDKGTMSGLIECNSYKAQYLVFDTPQKSKSMTISPITSTQKNCGNVTPLVKTYLSRLQNTSGFDISGQNLNIYDNTDDLKNSLIFKKIS